MSLIFVFLAPCASLCLQAVITQPDLLPKLPTRTDLHALTLHPEKGCQCKPGSQTSSSGTVQAEIGPGPLGAAAAESAEWQLGQLGDANTTCYIIYTSGSTGKPKVCK